jgi:hypothetical protein
VERAEVVGKYIHITLIPITQGFIDSGKLTANYVKKFILKG